MKSILYPSRTRILRIGETARDLLTPGQRGKVLAVFARAAYLVTELQELVYITPKDAPLHPRCLQVTGVFPRLTAGSPFSVDATCLNIDPSLALDLRQASVWQVPELSPRAVLPITEIPPRLKAVLASLDGSQAKGFGSLIPEIIPLAESGQIDFKPEMADPILSFAWPAIREIAEACLAHEVPELLFKSEPLIGLGEGLTPSGDDFLGGMLFCVHHLCTVYPFLPILPDKGDFIEAVGKRTNLISCSFLKDHARGHALEPLAQFFTAMLTGQPFTDVYRSLSRLTCLGHSTGWDLLTGALTGLLVTFQYPVNSTHLHQSSPFQIEHRSS